MGWSSALDQAQLYAILVLRCLSFPVTGKSCGRPRVPLHSPTLVYNPSNPSSCLMLPLSEINLSIPRPGVALETT
jgi:hypothetical protein